MWFRLQIPVYRAAVSIRQPPFSRQLLINPIDSGGHVKDALVELDQLAGVLIDDLIEQLQYEVVRETGLQHLQLAHVQVTRIKTRWFGGGIQKALISRTQRKRK